MTSTIRALIVDDEVSGAEVLRKDIAMYCPNVMVVDIAHSVDQAENKIRSNTIDIVFLDIQMPYANGFNLLERFAEINFEVIFTTAHSEYALKAIKHNALDYLLKPVDPDDLIAAIKKCEARLRKGPKVEVNTDTLISAITQLQRMQKLAVPTLDGLLYIDTGNIIRFEGDANYTNIHMIGGEKLLSSKTLKEFEQVLAGQNFFRIHKAHMINLIHTAKYVKGEGGYVHMIDGSQLEVSRQKKRELLALLSH